nr:YciI family protein [Actinomycetota bacterium]
GGAELTHSRGTQQVRQVGGVVQVTEGPYAETVEQLTGFYVVESDDLADLLDCVSIIADADAAIEVRAAVPGATA